MRPRQITVATYNLYVGADLSPLFTGTAPDRMAGAVARAWASVENSHPAERMAAAARVLGRRLPDVVAVQEAAVWRAGHPELPRRHDFLTDLLRALADAGTPYRVAVEAPAITSAAFSGPLAELTGQVVDLCEGSALLVRDDPAVTLQATRSDSFADCLTVPVLGYPVELTRAWCAATVGVEGAALTVFATHLEAFDARVRIAQARQLAGVVAPAAAERPVVVLGDLNCRPPGRRPPRAHLPATAQETDGEDAYELLVAAGLVDAWTAAHPDDPGGGATCGQAADLRNPRSALDERIDLVLADPRLSVAGVDVLGAAPGDRTRNGLWPSDHACVVTALQVR